MTVTLLGMVFIYLFSDALDRFDFGVILVIDSIEDELFNHEVKYETCKIFPSLLYLLGIEKHVDAKAAKSLEI